MPTPERWSGISRHHRTTPTIGIPRRCPFSSTARLTAARGSCSLWPRATATTSCSTGPNNGKNIGHCTHSGPNWAKSIRPNGTPEPDPAKQPQVDGALVSPNQGGATNWPPPTFSPQTGLFYVATSRAFSVYYIFDPDLANPQGWGGTDRGGTNLSSVGVGDRLQDRQDPLVPQVGDSRGTQRSAEHGGQPRVHRR